MKNVNKSDSLVVAICGIDGVGKSTLINMLKKEIFGQKDILFVNKKINTNYKLLKQYHGVLPEIEENWINSSFSRANSFACAFDFIEHYFKKINPYLSNHGKVIICDRHKPCWLAYGFLVGPVYKDICDLLQKIPEPNYTFYIHAPISLVKERLSRRGDKSYTSGAFACAYEQILGSMRNVIRISNDKSIEDTYSEFRDHIFRILRL